jgi:hypothetical protein
VAGGQVRRCAGQAARGPRLDLKRGTVRSSVRRSGIDRTDVES